MGHPNENFLKRFLDVRPLIEQRHLPGKKEIRENYKNQKQIPKENILQEQYKHNILSLTERMINKKHNIVEQKTYPNDWMPQVTPYGLFYFNKSTKQWMNTFGTIKDSLDELIGIFGQDYYSGGSDNVQVEVIQSYFSNSGTRLAVYNSMRDQVDIYSITYSGTPTTSYENSLDVGNIPFSGSSDQKCFVSDDGNYVVLSCPASKSIYFFDANANTLLQTITEEYPNFGSIIAVDKDFYGMAISTSELTRDPSYYDGRNSSFGISSPICYYKRNFGSSSTQRFKKIHTQNAYAQTRNNGSAQVTGFAKTITGYDFADAYMDRNSGSLACAIGVNRCGDIKVHGYNFAVSNYGLESDQINYKSHFPNFSNSRYDIIKQQGFTYSPCYSSTVTYKLMSATGGYTAYGQVELPAAVYSDEYMANKLTSNYYTENHASLKNFSIVRKINNKFITDSSYSDPGSISLITVPELSGITGGVNIYSNNFMGKMRLYANYGIYGTPPSNKFTNPYYDGFIRAVYRKDECSNTKIAINANDTYLIAKYTNDSNLAGYTTCISCQDLNLVNYRIYRFPSTNVDGTESYFYNDWYYQQNTYNPEPNPMTAGNGLVKIITKQENTSSLEQSFALATSQSNAATNPDPGIATAPIMQDPSSCPNSEFATYITNDLLEQNLISAYASNDRLFVNFNSNTIVFIINTAVSYKPLILEVIMSQSLSSYNFSFNENGEYFTKSGNVYKYNRTTKQIDLVHQV